MIADLKESNSEKKIDTPVILPSPLWTILEIFPFSNQKTFVVKAMRSLFRNTLNWIDKDSHLKDLEDFAEEILEYDGVEKSVK